MPILVSRGVGQLVTFLNQPLVSLGVTTYFTRLFKIESKLSLHHHLQQRSDYYKNHALT